MYKRQEYNLSLIPKTIEQSRAYVAARGAKILSYSITINGYDSMSSVMCTPVSYTHLDVYKRQG